MKSCFLVLALAIFVLPPTTSDAWGSLAMDNAFPARTLMHEIRDEVDPTDPQSCNSMGQINLTYDTGEVGPPNVGLRITDPRGRKIGYDLRSDKGWQELPLAEGFFDCDEDEDTSKLRNCAGHIQICGPISGTYQVEVLPVKRSKYSISISSTSRETWDELGFHSARSQIEFKSETKDLAPEILLLEYSREAGAQNTLTRSDQRVAARKKSQTGKSYR
jgi:hypothetical protein